jgi:ankyrin repeat protein
MISAGIGRTVTIHSAAQAGNLAIVKTMLGEKPNLVSRKNCDGARPLHLAALYGRKDVVELLLANKADLNARDCSRATPLFLASTMDHRDIAELLRQHGGKE